MSDKYIFPYEEKSENELSKIVKNVYDCIDDEISRRIYINRLLLTLTGNAKYIRKLICETYAGKKLDSFLCSQKKIYLYGAGVRGQRISLMYPDANLVGYIDKIKTGVCNGLPIFELDEASIESDADILITNLSGARGIKRDLIDLGIDESHILSLEDFDNNALQDQYFENRCISKFSRTNGCFVDAGCFDGADTLRFLKSPLYSGQTIYAFEPDKNNLQKCRATLGKYPNVNICGMGLSDKKGRLAFCADNEKARFATDGDEYVEVGTIDEVLKNVKVDFIKMDIEGSELAAIRGASFKIRECRPNLMISVYHRKNDIIEIPAALLKINPEYRFAFGHYAAASPMDTVLYAF